MQLSKTMCFLMLLYCILDILLIIYKQKQIYILNKHNLKLSVNNIKAKLLKKRIFFLNFPIANKIPWFFQVQKKLRISGFSCFSKTREDILIWYKNRNIILSISLARYVNRYFKAHHLTAIIDPSRIYRSMFFNIYAWSLWLNRRAILNLKPSRFRP